MVLRKWNKINKCESFFLLTNYFQWFSNGVPKTAVNGRQQQKQKVTTTTKKPSGGRTTTPQFTTPPPPTTPVSFLLINLQLYFMARFNNGSIKSI